jgi:hypothetical protein
MRGWSAAIGDGSVEVFGAPKLVEALPSWFARDETGVSDENGLLHAPAMTNHSVAPVRAPAAANPIELS